MNPGRIIDPGGEIPNQRAFCLHLRRGSDQLGICLSKKQVAQMVCHAAQLEKWNRQINLTAITDPLAMAQKHFLDAMAIQSFVCQEKTVLDMGSGAGFPGLPVKLLNEKMQMVLVDASRKKVNFLKHVIRMLGVTDISAIHGRVERFHQNPDFAGRFDAVLARGFAALSPLAYLAFPLLKPRGTIYALKGPGIKEEITPDLENRFLIQCDFFNLPFQGPDRCLVRLTPKQNSS